MSEISDLTRTVVHPQLGPGKLLKTYMGGYEWEVMFESGRRFRLPAREFTAESTSAWQAQTAPATNGFTPREPVLELDQFRARQTLEALRLGIVPVQDVETLTIGLEAERVSLDRALARSKERGGDVQAVIGDYGFGKSHFIELAARRGLRENFLVATASLDLVETPPSKAHEIYRALTRSIRYPDSDERGLGPLIKQALGQPNVIGRLAELAPREDCPLTAALGALADCGSQVAYDDMVQWISGQILPTAEMKTCLKRPPRLYRSGEVARQYTYLLTAISVLATLTGYSGLAVLIDESEHYLWGHGTGQQPRRPARHPQPRPHRLRDHLCKRSAPVLPVRADREREPYAGRCLAGAIADCAAGRSFHRARHSGVFHHAAALPCDRLCLPIPAAARAL
jgi:hypothetical protein